MNFCSEMMVGREAGDSKKLLRIDSSDGAIVEFFRLIVSCIQDELKTHQPRLEGSQALDRKNPRGMILEAASWVCKLAMGEVTEIRRRVQSAQPTKTLEGRANGCPVAA